MSIVEEGGIERKKEIGEQEKKKNKNIVVNELEIK